MKHLPHTIPQGAKPTSADVLRWTRELERLHGRLAPYFARPEPRQRALAYLQAILSDLPRKNSWQIAEHAREARPDGMQRLLGSSVWDADLVRDELRAYIRERLADPLAIVVIDETSFPKRGKKSAGVARKSSGATKQRQNCQVGVFLSYVSSKGHTLLDRQLYIPKRWFADPERCLEAGIPQSRRFQTKCELARTMIKRLVQAHVPIRWVVADTVYGTNQDLRDDLEGEGIFYALAVRCTEAIEIQMQTGRERMTVADVGARLQKTQEWHRLSMGEGTKGPRLFDWAAIPMLHRCQDDRHHFLLLRRDLCDPTDIRYSFVFGPEGTRLAEMVEAVGARWRIEEDFEAGKDLGLDQYEVRSYLGWYRHVTLVMLALADFSSICAQDHPGRSGEQESLLLPVSRPEVCHLLAHLIWPPACNVTFVLAWSWWRRCHGWRASTCHTKRREKAREAAGLFSPFL